MSPAAIRKLADWCDAHGITGIEEISESPSGLHVFVDLPSFRAAAPDVVGGVWESDGCGGSYRNLWATLDGITVVATETREAA